MKGAPEVVLARCAAGGPGPRRSPRSRRWPGAGMRVLAVAERGCDGTGEPLEQADVSGGFELLGLVGMIDPPRPEAIAAVGGLPRAGIAVKMITGDHRGTAQAIGRAAGPRSGPAPRP